MIGLPVGGIILLYNLEQVILTALLADFSSEVSDGYGIGARIFGLFFMINFGIGLGISVAVGHAIGAGKTELIWCCIPRLSLLFVGFLSILAVLIVVSADGLMLAFSSEPQTVHTGASYLRFMGFTNLALGLMYCYNGVFEGAGRTMPPLVIAAIMYLVFEFPILTYLSWFGVVDLSWIWFTVMVTYTIGAALIVRQFYKSRWNPNPVVPF